MSNSFRVNFGRFFDFEPPVDTLPVLSKQEILKRKEHSRFFHYEGIQQAKKAYEKEGKPKIRLLEVIQKVLSVFSALLSVLMPLAIFYLPSWVPWGIGLPAILLLIYAQGKIHSSIQNNKIDGEFIPSFQKMIGQHRYRSLHPIGSHDLPKLDPRLKSDKMMRHEVEKPMRRSAQTIEAIIGSQTYKDFHKHISLDLEMTSFVQQTAANAFSSGLPLTQFRTTLREGRAAVLPQEPESLEAFRARMIDQKRAAYDENDQVLLLPLSKRAEAHSLVLLYDAFGRQFEQVKTSYQEWERLYPEEKAGFLKWDEYETSANALKKEIEPLLNLFYEESHSKDFGLLLNTIKKRGIEPALYLLIDQSKKMVKQLDEKIANHPLKKHEAIAKKMITFLEKDSLSENERFELTEWMQAHPEGAKKKILELSSQAQFPKALKKWLQRHPESRYLTAHDLLRQTDKIKKKILEALEKFYFIVEEPGPKGLQDSSSFKDFGTTLHGSPNPVLKDRDCGLAYVPKKDSGLSTVTLKILNQQITTQYSGAIPLFLTTFSELKNLEEKLARWIKKRDPALAKTNISALSKRALRYFPKTEIGKWLEKNRADRKLMAEKLLEKIVAQKKEALCDFETFVTAFSKLKNLESHLALWIKKRTPALAEITIATLLQNRPPNPYSEFSKDELKQWPQEKCTQWFKDQFGQWMQTLPTNQIEKWNAQFAQSTLGDFIEGIIEPWLKYFPEKEIKQWLEKHNQDSSLTAEQLLEKITNQAPELPYPLYNEKLDHFKKETLIPLERLIARGGLSHFSDFLKIIFFKIPAQPFRLGNSFSKKANEELYAAQPYFSKRRVAEIKLDRRLKAVDQKMLAVNQARVWGLRAPTYLLFAIEGIVSLYFSNPWIFWGFSALAVLAEGASYYVNERLKLMEKKKEAIKLQYLLRNRPDVSYIPGNRPALDRLKEVQQKYFLDGVAPTWSRILAEGDSLLKTPSRKKAVEMATKAKQKAGCYIENSLISLKSAREREEDPDKRTRIKNKRRALKQGSGSKQALNFLKMREEVLTRYASGLPSDFDSKVKKELKRRIQYLKNAQIVVKKPTVEELEEQRKVKLGAKRAAALLEASERYDNKKIKYATWIQELQKEIKLFEVSEKALKKELGDHWIDLFSDHWMDSFFVAKDQVACLVKAAEGERGSLEEGVTFDLIQAIKFGTMQLLSTVEKDKLLKIAHHMAHLQRMINFYGSKETILHSHLNYLLKEIKLEMRAVPEEQQNSVAIDEWRRREEEIKVVFQKLPADLQQQFYADLPEPFYSQFQPFFEAYTGLTFCRRIAQVMRENDSQALADYQIEDSLQEAFKKIGPIYTAAILNQLPDSLKAKLSTHDQ